MLTKASAPTGPPLGSPQLVGGKPDLLRSWVDNSFAINSFPLFVKRQVVSPVPKILYHSVFDLSPLESNLLRPPRYQPHGITSLQETLEAMGWSFPPFPKWVRNIQLLPLRVPLKNVLAEMEA
jgi:hypothetical protein